DGAGAQPAEYLPDRVESPERAHSKHDRGRWSNKGVYRIPYVVQIRDLVGHELNQKEQRGQPEYQRMRLYLQCWRQRAPAESLKEPSRGNHGVDVQSRSE